MTPPDRAALASQVISEISGHAYQEGCDGCDARYRVVLEALENAHQHGLAAGRQEPAARLQKLLSAYRAKRAVDGLNDRPWDASKHLEAEETIVELESAIRLSQDMPMQPTPPATGREGT